jgi:magnesium transporter
VAQLTRLHPHLIHDQLRAYFRDIYDHVLSVNAPISATLEILGAVICVTWRWPPSAR